MKRNPDRGGDVALHAGMSAPKTPGSGRVPGARWKTGKIGNNSPGNKKFFLFSMHMDNVTLGMPVPMVVASGRRGRR